MNLSEYDGKLFDNNGDLFGVLDIDSPVLNRFSKEDKEGLEEIAVILD